MFESHPFYLATTVGNSSGVFVRLNDKLHKKGGTYVDEFQHKAELEWILDFDGYHVEGVSVLNDQFPILNLQFNFKKWGYNFDHFKEATRFKRLCGVLSLRMFGFLIDAWEIDATKMESHSYGNAMKITVKAIVDKMKQLPRIKHDFYLRSTSLQLQGVIMHENRPYIFACAKPSIPLSDITVRQFLTSITKQYLGVRLYRTNTGFVHS